MDMLISSADPVSRDLMALYCTVEVKPPMTPFAIAELFNAQLMVIYMVARAYYMPFSYKYNVE